MNNEIIIGLIIAIIGLIGIIIKEHSANKRLRKELQSRKEELERNYQLKQQEMAIKQRQKNEIEESKKQLNSKKDFLDSTLNRAFEIFIKGIKAD